MRTSELTELPLSMATRFDTQHNEGSSATQCALKKRRTFVNIRPEEVKYGIAAANLSRFHDCPNRCVSKVAITDQHGNVVGHVSSYVDKSRSTKSTDDCRLCLGGVTNSSTSTVTSQQTTFEGTKLLYRQSVCVTSPDNSGKRNPGLNHKLAKEQYSSGDDDYQNSIRSSEESYTDTNDKQPTKTTTECNSTTVADICKWHDARSVQSRLIPKIDGIFTCVGASSGGKPPLGPSRLRRGVLSGSKSSDCLQAIPVDCNPNERGGRTFARESQSIDFTAVASKSKSIAVVEGVEGEVATKHQHHLQHQHQQGGRFTVKSRNTAEQARQLNTVTPENKKLSVTIPLDHGNSRTCRALFHDVTPVTPIASEDTSIKPQTQPHPTPNLSMKRSASLSSLSTPTPSDGYASNTSTRKKIKVSQGPLLKLNAPTASFQLLTRFNSLKDSWIASSRKLASAKSVDWNVLRKTVFVAAHAPPHSLPPSLTRPSSISSLHPTPLPSPLSSSNPLSGCKSFSLRTFALQQLSAICTEQDRLRALFISDVSRALGYRIRGAADRINCLYGTHLLDRSERSPSVQQIVHNYQKLSIQQLERQEHALRWAIAVDGMADPSSVPTTGRNEQYVPRPKLSFRHSDIFRTALLFEHTAYSMIAEAEAGTIEEDMAGI